MAESKANIELFNQTEQSLPLSPSDCHVILSTIMSHEDCSFDFVEVVYVNEEEIVRLNREHLERAYVTDIISFRYDDESDGKEGIQGTLFCCAPRISEQAGEFGEPEKKEFQRILIHGLLHLVGYDDRSEEKYNDVQGKFLS